MRLKVPTGLVVLSYLSTDEAVQALNPVLWALLHKNYVRAIGEKTLNCAPSMNYDFPPENIESTFHEIQEECEGRKILLTGTSLKKFELKWWRTAEKYGYRTIALIDPYNCKEAKARLGKKPPRSIFVPNDDAFHDLVKREYDGERLYVTGSPRMEDMLQKGKIRKTHPEVNRFTKGALQRLLDEL